jgi:hypothetical protein
MRNRNLAPGSMHCFSLRPTRNSWAKSSSMNDFWQAEKIPTETDDAPPHRPGQPSPGPMGIKELQHFARESN